MNVYIDHLYGVNVIISYRRIVLYYKTILAYFNSATFVKCFLNLLDVLCKNKLI